MNSRSGDRDDLDAALGSERGEAADAACPAEQHEPIAAAERDVLDRRCGSERRVPHDGRFLPRSCAACGWAADPEADEVGHRPFAHKLLADEAVDLIALAIGLDSGPDSLDDPDASIPITSGKRCST